MLFYICFAGIFATTTALVCLPGVCDNIKQAPVNCKGQVLKNSGYCGCYTQCAKVEGESCVLPFLMGVPTVPCETGLTCVTDSRRLLIAGVCQKSADQKSFSSNVAANPRSTCQQMRIQSLISMIVFRGQWFPKCQPDGLFEKQQCNNIGQCFCVDQNTGKVIEGTKVTGAATCT